MPAEVMHRYECMCFLEFLDAYLKKKKKSPSYISSDDVSFKVYEPDV